VRRVARDAARKLEKEEFEMSMQVRVEALKQQFEQLFPGKWLTNHKRSRLLSTGLQAIDSGVTRGIARKRITQWSGPCSSGKRTLLRNAITHWCAGGLNVAYIDCEGKLYPADWASIESEGSGKFWIVRPEGDKTGADSGDTGIVPLISRKNLFVQEAIWSADQFVRSCAFDVVILDLGLNELGNKKSMGMGYCPVPGRVYARLQRALDKSKAALIIVSDRDLPAADDSALQSTQMHTHKQAQDSSDWGCHARFLFKRGLATRFQSGLNGIAVIVPTIKLSAFRAGLSQEVEVNLGSSVPNRLFTHPQIPDRRASKG
jgi:RecA/RadA recombinase